MQNWAVALIAGSLQLLLAQLILRRHGLLAKCIRRAWSFRRPRFTCKRSLKLWLRHSLRHSHARADLQMRTNTASSGAQRHWDVLRSHVFEQAHAKRSREAQYNRGYLQTLRRTVTQKTLHHHDAQADDLQVGTATPRRPLPPLVYPQSHPCPTRRTRRARVPLAAPMYPPPSTCTHPSFASFSRSIFSPRSKNRR